MFDLHVHTAYSDGMQLYDIINEAENAGLDAVGVVDHAVITDDPTLHRHKVSLAHVFDKTFRLRREALERYRDQTDLRIYDGIELDYQSDDEEILREFLRTASFEYATGSVHYVFGTNIQFSEAFDGHNEAELDAVVEEYYTQLESLIRSELFDIAAHPDLIERNPRTAGRTTVGQADRIAAAFAESRTTPEFNAGSIGSTPAADVHPRTPLRDRLLEADVPFTYGSDAHNRGEIGSRKAVLRSVSDTCAAQILRPETVCHNTV